MRGRRLHVRLLGGLDLRLGEAPVPPLDSARAESLLAYLLLHRDAPQQRQHLAFLLWPDSTEAQARTNLRHVLHNLRRALPDADRFIEVRPRTLQWRPEAPVLLDVAVFEQALVEGRLQDAVETYRGDLLEGSYDDWLLEERERLAQRHRDALEQLARKFEGERRWSEAIRCAERLVRADPLREEAYRLLMRLCDASGDRARALRVYHECAATLQRELRVEPAAATRAAYEALLAVAGDAGTREPGVSAVDRPGTAPFVGRATERARLAAVWRTAEGGSAQLVLVTGEPGVGKSRLVEELRSWCAHRGAVTAGARAYAAEGDMAYGLVVAWLRSERIVARLRRLDRVHLTELARLLPEMVSQVPNLARPEPLPESEQRQRLFDAVTRALLAAGTPLLLVADDVQWCDVESLRFMHYLLRAEPDARLLIAATARAEEIDARHPANQLVAALQTLGRACEIGLERLTREETTALAERIVGRRLDEDAAERLYVDSEGNALFVVEALRADAQAGAARDAGSAVGSRVQALIAARLAQLSKTAAELVGVAATIGREFTTEVLADASGADDQRLVRDLDELWRRGIVRAHGPRAYDFSHDKIREAAYGALGPARARHHHLRVAHALERAHATNLDSVRGQIAAHHDRAGAEREAVEWYVAAAEAAQRLHASADAVRFLERALQLASDLAGDSGRIALELTVLTALLGPLVAVEGYLSERFEHVHERALALTHSLGVEAPSPLLRSLALTALTRGDFDAARALGEQLRARAERERDDVDWVESAYVLGIAAYWQGQLRAARAHFEAAVERYRPEQSGAHLLRYGQDAQVVCLTRLAHTLWLLGLGEQASHAREAGFALAEQLGQPHSRHVATVFAAVLALDDRDEERLRCHARELSYHARAHGAPHARSIADAFAGLVDVLDGGVQPGLDGIRAALDDARSSGPAAPGHLGILVRMLLEAYAISGNAQAGLALAEEALVLGGGTQLWEAEIRRLRAEFLAALGAGLGEVEAELQRALEIAQRQGARAFAQRVHATAHRLAASAD